MSRHKARHEGAPGAGEVSARAVALTEALDIGGHRLEPASSRRGRELAGRVTDRMRLSGEHTVVALAGATGSGKSSLFNALTRLDIAAVGARRPTTSAAAACVYGAENAGPLLEWLGVPAQHRVSQESALDSGDDRLQGLVLLDLPDHDSTELSHRLEVDRLVELVDLFVWVTDPQKYADAALHRRYLSKLAGHDAVTVVVLNHADRLSPEALETCRRDLERLVAADGLREVEVMTTSATRGDGVPGLREELATAVARRNAWSQRLSADLDTVAEELTKEVGEPHRPASALLEGSGLTPALESAAGVPRVVSAVGQAYQRDAVGAAGWPVTRWTRRLRPDPLRRLHLRPAVEGGSKRGADADAANNALQLDADLARSSLSRPTPGQRAAVELALRRVGDQAAQGLPARWATAARAAAEPSPADLSDAVDQAIVSADLGLTRPRWWMVLAAVQLVLLLAAIAGLVWLVVLAVTAWLKLPEPGTPYLGAIPVPTLMLIGGLVIGILIGLVVRWVAPAAGRRRGARVSKRLSKAVQAVAEQRVVAPAEQVLADHRATLDALQRARS
ncbi:GTPase [Angustibacter sp. McL0619]|uniref:GTPase n=1 Tax=Angustibacter sp. McL0619 TaxID=3415676 RepID=UPI003CF205D8